MSLLLAAAPLAGACVVCAALGYGLRLKPAPRLQESPQDSTRAVLLPPPTAADIRTWERNLYDWAALRDPTLLVLPNERFGFSRERSARLEVPSAAVPDYEFALPPIAAPSRLSMNASPARWSRFGRRRCRCWRRSLCRG